MSLGLVFVVSSEGYYQSPNFQLIGGSYVFKDGRVGKVPGTTSEALETDLVGFMGKHRLQKFVSFAYDYLDAPDVLNGLWSAGRETGLAAALPGYLGK